MGGSEGRRVRRPGPAGTRPAGDPRAAALAALTVVFVVPGVTFFVDMYRKGLFTPRVMEDAPPWLPALVLLWQVLAGLHITVPVALLGSVGNSLAVRKQASGVQRFLWVLLPGLGCAAVANCLYTVVQMEDLNQWRIAGVVSAVAMPVVLAASEWALARVSRMHG